MPRRGDRIGDWEVVIQCGAASWACVRDGERAVVVLGVDLANGGHPSLPRVVDRGVDDGTPFVALAEDGPWDALVALTRALQPVSAAIAADAPVDEPAVDPSLEVFGTSHAAQQRSVWAPFLAVLNGGGLFR